MFSNYLSMLAKYLIQLQKQSVMALGYISEDAFMIARHCLSSGKPKLVQFNATNSFYDQGLTFNVLEEIDIHSPTARGLGIKTDPYGDIALLKIAPLNGELPGKIFGFT